MKKSIFKFIQCTLLLCTSASSLPAFCHTNQNIDQEEVQLEKIYIDSSNIQIDKKQIYVYLDEDWVPTNAIYSDTQGTYIIQTKGGWTCSRCDYYNEDNNWTCDKCGARRD